MAQPSKKDYDNYERILNKLGKGLLEDGSPKRKVDENIVKDLFRKGVRMKWMRSYG